MGCEGSRSRCDACPHRDPVLQQDMLRLNTNGTDFMHELLSTENQYRTALSVLSSAGATRDAALPELSDEEKLRVIEIARTMVVAPA